MVVIRYLFFILCFYFFDAFFAPVKANAQKQPVYTSSELLHAIKKLKSTASVLYIAAHPDDENTRLLTYFAKEKLYRTAYLSLTRGEGGQNLIGDEQGTSLGLIRTEELLSARRIDGAEQFFASAEDFGYSKSKEETLQKWDKEKILDNIVRIIRSFQPDLIIARFPPDKRAGHGHHAASALLAADAFDLAADSAKFVHHFKEGLLPWRTKALYWNTYNFGSANTITPDQLTIDVGGYNALLGKSYGEIAAESRSQHKSQGFGSAAQRGSQFEYFLHVKGDTVNMLTDNDYILKQPLGKEMKSIHKRIDKIIADYQIEKPAASVPALMRLYNAVILNNARDVYRITQLRQIIMQASALFAEAFTSQKFTVAGDSLIINSFLINRSNVKVKLRSISMTYGGKDTMYNDFSLLRNQPYKYYFSIFAPNYATGDYLSVSYHFLIEDIPFSIIRNLQYKFTDPVKGEISWPLVYYPAITIEPVQKLFLVKRNSDTIKVSFKIKKILKTNTGTQYGYLCIRLPEKDSCLNSFSLNSITDNDTIITSNVLAANLQSHMSFYVKYNNQIFDKYITTITYDHIPSVSVFDKSDILFPKLNYTIAGRKIAYIEGAGDGVDEAMRLMGYQVDILSKEDISYEKLTHYDALVTGIRAYNQHDWLADKHAVFMRYVDSGGVMLIQYNTSSQIGPLKNNRWLFPFTISRNRVSEEDAKVIIIEPQHAVFNHPNEITETDFDQWVQERSVYETDSIAVSCKTLLSMHDKDEPDRKGSLIIDERGKGRLIYTGLTFFRQLPAGVREHFVYYLIYWLSQYVNLFA